MAWPDRLDVVARACARITAVAAGLSATLLIRYATTVPAELGTPPLLVAALSVAMAVGLWRLHALALQVATTLLILAGVLLPIGMLSPFRVMDEAPAVREAPGYVMRSVAVAFVSAGLCLGLAFLLHRARRKRG